MRQIARENGTDDITLRDLWKAILKELNILEVGHLKTINEPKSTVSCFTCTKSENKRQVNDSPTMEKKKHACVFCGENHSATDFKKVSNVKARKDFVKERKLCLTV